MFIVLFGFLLMPIKPEPTVDCHRLMQWHGDVLTKTLQQQLVGKKNPFWKEKENPCNCNLQDHVLSVNQASVSKFSVFHLWCSMRKSYIHYNYVIMGAMGSQITSLTIVYSTVYSCEDQRKHQSSASLAFFFFLGGGGGVHRGLVNFPHKGTVTRKMFPVDDVIMVVCSSMCSLYNFWTSVFLFYPVFVFYSVYTHIS